MIEENPNLIVLDVRTHGEYNLGHIKNAINISYDQLTSRINEITDFKEDIFLVYCESGRRSKEAVAILLENEFNNIYQMYEGYKEYKEIEND